VTRGQLPERAGSLGLNGGGTATAVPPTQEPRSHIRSTRYRQSPQREANVRRRLCGMSCRRNKPEHTASYMFNPLTPSGATWVQL